MTMLGGGLTGTPSGVGSVREPPAWLKPGDEIVVRSPTLGELRTSIARRPGGLTRLPEGT